ncbi:peptidylprolyl isomerase [Candidatus Sumerlaeota bacterium]|nr:peptidylprolyl isomerase [Candidatus Sumerlaeota bacterium]
MIAIACSLLVTKAGAALDEGPQLDATKDYYAVIVTNLGSIRVKMRTDLAPIAVRNFINLAEGTREFKDSTTGQTVKRPYYNGIIFHRVGPNFMIQGGDPTGTGSGGPGYTIKDEYNEKHIYDKGGYLAMARTGAPNSGGSQFFVTEGPTPGLNTQYTQFGEVVGTQDIDVVKRIARSPLGARNPDGTGKPAKDVAIQRIDVIRVEKGTPTDKVAFEKAAAAAPAAEEKKADAPKAEEKKAEAPKAEEKATETKDATK